MDEAAHREAYRAFLRSRWVPRSRRLGRYAAAGNLVFFVFDALLTRGLAAPPALAELAAARLPWVALPLLGALVVARFRAWRGVPLTVMAFSIAYTWGNDWAYHALGLGGSPIQALALVTCILTAATFLPLALGARVGVLVLQCAGHVALEWALPQARALDERLWTALAVVILAVCVTIVFESFSAAQRRRLRLRHELEQSVREAEESRRRAIEAASALERLATRVAHEVNNPLAAVKGNVSYLREAEDGGEREEVIAETLAAVDRIAQIVGELRRISVSGEPDRARAPPGDAPARGAASRGRGG